MAGLLKRFSMSKGKNPTAADNFKNGLSSDEVSFFNEVATKGFSHQAVAFLNVYWDEIGDQADFIFECAYETMKYADMHTTGVTLIHLYEEGSDVEFNVGLYFYEHLCKRVYDSSDSDPQSKWRKDPKYKISLPEQMTAITRKQELRDKVDVNFDGKISFLEYLLYQYRSVANPAQFTDRAMKAAGVQEHPKIVAARIALDDVNMKIRAYEAEKARLEQGALLDGVKGKTFAHQLTMLLSSPVANELQVALIKAEAAVRMAVRAVAGGNTSDGDAPGRNAGAMYWMNKDLEEKKRLYGPNAAKKMGKTK